MSARAGPANYSTGLTMQLLLIRHAIAVERRDGASDAARPLTPKGRKRFRSEVKGLERLGLRIERLYTSPWVRAVETSKELASVVGDVRLTKALARAPDESLLGEVKGDIVAMVGHEPWLSQLVSMLMFGTMRQAEAFELKKGGIAWLDGELAPGQMRLVALLTPRVLRSLGE